MQVELIQIFGNSMVESPWYRFPFLDYMNKYFEVLLNEIPIVAKRHGWASALASSAFITDLVPGIAMTIVYAQLQVMAYPIKKYVFGSEYDSQSLCEKIVIIAPRNTNWTSIDSRIKDIYEVYSGLWLLTIPTFKPFTAVLLEITRKLPAATILQISNQTAIQIRLELTCNPDDKPKIITNLNALHGVEVLFDFSYPKYASSDKPKPQILCAVQVPNLIGLLNYCLTNGDLLSVIQVYDYYSS